VKSNDTSDALPIKTNDQTLYSIFFEESLKLVAESKNHPATGMPGNLHQLQA
jgi:hypothetical protein